MAGEQHASSWVACVLCGQVVSIQDGRVTRSYPPPGPGHYAVCYFICNRCIADVMDQAVQQVIQTSQEK